MHLDPSLFRLDVGQAEGVEGVLVIGGNVVMMILEMSKKIESLVLETVSVLANFWEVHKEFSYLGLLRQQQ